MNILIISIVVTVIVIILLFITFVVGFTTGWNARERKEIETAEQRRIGACMEHWHGHTTHKGTTIFSPARVKSGIQ